MPFHFHFQPNDEMKSGRNLFASALFVFDALAEDFQEQEVLSMFSGRTCQRERLEESIHHDCGQYFHQVMMFFHPEDRCVLKDIIGYESLPLTAAESNSSTVNTKTRHQTSSASA